MQCQTFTYARNNNNTPISADLESLIKGKEWEIVFTQGLEVKQAAKLANDKVSEARICAQLTAAAFEKGDYEQALTFAARCHELSDHFKDPSFFARVLYIESAICRRQGKFTEAEKLATAALNHYTENGMNDPLLLGTIYANLRAAHADNPMGNLAEAIKYFTFAFDLFSQAQASDDYTLASIRLGILKKDYALCEKTIYNVRNSAAQMRIGLAVDYLEVQFKLAIFDIEGAKKAAALGLNSARAQECQGEATFFQTLIDKCNAPQAMYQTYFPDLTPLSRGKVRDNYDMGDGTILIVATDRISAFDVILPNAIPGKGKTLTQLSLFWFKLLADIVPNHLITANVEEYPEKAQKYRAQLEGRSMLVKKAEVLDIECIVRGYITGTGWKDYEKTGHVCGIELKKGLQKSEKLDAPIFTPSTKAKVGHDENITFAKAAEIVGDSHIQQVKTYSLALYEAAAKYALTKGIILCDTKFEFGVDKATGKIIVVDEVLTPDSSRFWDCNDYHVGEKENNSFDKQFVRNYLEDIKWNKKPPAPFLPEDIVRKTQEKYAEILRRLMS